MAIENMEYIALGAVIFNCIVVVVMIYDVWRIHRKLNQKIMEHQQLFDTIVDYSNKTDYRLKKLEQNRKW